MQSFNPRALATGGLIAMASAIGIGRFVYTPILPAMVEALHLTKGAAGLIASANFVGYLLGALTAASSLGRANPRNVLVGAMFVSAATTAAMAWSHAMPAFLAWRFIGGVASAYVLVLASALVLDRLAKVGRGQLSAVHFSGVGTGIAVSAILTWVLASQGFDWRAMWLWSGVVALVGTAAVAMLVEPGEATSAATPASQTAPWDARLRNLTIAYGLFGFGYIITATFIVVIVRGSPEAARVEPIFWLVFGLTAIPSVALWVAAGRRFGIMQVYALACIVEAIGVLASVTWPTVAGLFIASALLGGTFMGLTALGLIAARDLAPTAARRWVAILTAAFGLGQIVGPVIAGYGFDLTGSFFLPSMLAVLGLCVSAALAMSVSRSRPT